MTTLFFITARKSHLFQPKQENEKLLFSGSINGLKVDWVIEKIITIKNLVVDIFSSFFSFVFARKYGYTCLFSA